MKRLRCGLTWIAGGLLFLSIGSASAQTITCPTKLDVTGIVNGASTFQTTNTFGPGTAQVSISDSQMVCAYSLFTEWSVAFPDPSCSSLHVSLTASLPNPYSPQLPPGYSPWVFSQATTPMYFKGYLNGSCQYFGSTRTVLLESAIPSGYTCSAAPPAKQSETGSSTFSCSPPRAQVCLPGQYADTSGDLLACRACT